MTLRVADILPRNSNFRLGILGRQDNRYVRDLQRAATELGLSTELLEFQALQARLLPMVPEFKDEATVGRDRMTLSAWSGNQPVVPSEPSAILVRSMPLGSLEQIIFRMDALQIWQAQGVPILNSPACLETSIDKWLTLHRLHLAGIRVPATIACQERHQAMEAFERLGQDILVKPLFGGEGRGIIRLQDKDLAWRAFSTLQQLGHVIYLQKFIPHFGYDVRVLVIGKELLSIRRRARQGEYRTNISQGGLAEPHQLSDAHSHLAARCAAAVGGDIVGVDLLPAEDGECYALEVNAVPGWKAVASCLNVDVAQRIVAYAYEKAGIEERDEDRIFSKVSK